MTNQNPHRLSKIKTEDRDCKIRNRSSTFGCELQIRWTHRWVILLIFVMVSLSGCKKNKPAAAAAQSPTVFVLKPVTTKVVDFEDFIGQTKSQYTVDIRPRATGYILTANFKDGSLVNEGDVLFTIDPRPYEATRDHAKATVAQNEALLSRLNLDLSRAKALQPRGAVSTEELQKITGDQLQAQATLDSARADLKTAELNLSFCKITAPISGRISRRQFDPGNLVKADETILTTLVSLDPMYAYFDVDERTLLRLRRLVFKGTIPSVQKARIDVQIGLADDEGFPLTGFINFTDNRVDVNSGTLNLRAEIDNRNHFLSPGLFVRVRLPIGREHSALMIPEMALGSDQGQRFVYVVNDQDVVEYRTVGVGLLHKDMRVIESGLKPNERVIVTGIQRVRPDSKVIPKPYVGAKSKDKKSSKDPIPPSNNDSNKDNATKQQTWEKEMKSKMNNVEENSTTAKKTDKNSGKKKSTSNTDSELEKLPEPRVLKPIEHRGK